MKNMQTKKRSKLNVTKTVSAAVILGLLLTAMPQNNLLPVANVAQAAPDYAEGASFTINGGANYTYDRNVILEITVSIEIQPTQVWIKNENKEWKKVTLDSLDSIPWELSEGFGEKTVSIRFNDNDEAPADLTKSINYTQPIYPPYEPEPTPVEPEEPGDTEEPTDPVVEGEDPAGEVEEEQPTDTDEEVVNEDIPQFSDIAGHWAEDAINQAAAAGIVNGYVDGTMQPDANVTRAEFTVMVARALQLNAAQPTLSFADTSAIGSWAQAAIKQAMQAQLVFGYDNNQFRPNTTLSQSEMATILARVAELQAASTTPLIETGKAPVSRATAITIVVDTFLQD